MVGLCGCVILSAMGILLLSWKNEIPVLGITVTSVGFLPIFLKIYDGYRRAQSHSIAVQMLKYLKLPEYHKHLGLIPALKKDIQILCDLRLKRRNKKLLVIVDDLDRCQPECISKTLDAIRLVMSIPSVIVMIGIDHRIAFKAVEKTYEELGDSCRSEADIARDYLGKIILLPVRLTRTEKSELKDYVDQKLYLDAIQIPKEPLAGSTTDFKVEDADRDFAPESSETDSLDPAKTTSPTTLKEGGKEQTIEEAMRETTEERDHFYALAVNFEFSNPRQLLRLRNCYRLLKALNSQKGYQIESLLPMIFWQEFLHGLRREERDFCMASLKDKGYIEKIRYRDVKEIIEKVYADIVKLFQLDGKYAEIARFVRCVVLPHSEEGVFDTLEEIEEWFENQNGIGNENGQTQCPLGLKIV